MSSGVSTRTPNGAFNPPRDLAFALETPFPSGPQTALSAAFAIAPVCLMIPAAAIVIAAIAVAAAYLLLRLPAPVTWTGVMLGGPEMAHELRAFLPMGICLRSKRWWTASRKLR